MSRTKKDLAAAIIADLPEKMDLVYVDRGDKLTDEQVGFVVAGDFESLWSSTTDWESENRWQGTKGEIESRAKDVVNAWGREDDQDYDDLLSAFDLSDEYDEVRWAMEERESGDWIRDLMSGNDDVLLRINCIDEDNGYGFEQVLPEQVLMTLGFEVSNHNRFAVQDMLDECSPEYSVLLGYWVVGVSVRDMYELPRGEGNEVDITNPYLYMGNPFAGTGWISSALQGTARVKAEDLLTDKAAFGYSVEDVFGGVHASQYSATITPVPTTTAQEG